MLNINICNVSDYIFQKILNKNSYYECLISYDQTNALEHCAISTHTGSERERESKAAVVKHSNVNLNKVSDSLQVKHPNGPNPSKTTS